MLTCIYGLVDPRYPDWVMYVGKGFENRAKIHWKNFLKTGEAGNALLRHWFEKLLFEGIEPIWYFLEENVINWQEREQHWITLWREINPNLCNVLDGGNQWPIDSCSLGGTVGCKTMHLVKDDTGKSVIAKKAGFASHAKRDDEGKSIRGRKFGYLYGYLGAKEIHSRKNSAGKSIRGIELNRAIHSQKDSEGKSILARQNGFISGPIVCHNRWHVRRGIINPNCKLCQEAQSA